MTDREAIAAGHWAALREGVGNVGLARYHASVRVTWRRRDRLGEHAELEWRASRDTPAYALVTARGGPPTAYLVA